MLRAVCHRAQAEVQMPNPYSGSVDVEANKKPLASREAPETTVLLPTGHVLGPPLPGQGWLAEFTPSLDAG